MKILVIGGTRYFGIPMTKALIAAGHQITIATRGQTADPYGDAVSRIRFDRADEAGIAAAFRGHAYDVIVDKIAYSSNDVRRLLEHVSCGRYILMSSAAVYGKMRENTPESDFDPAQYPLRWCERADADYAEVKRQAECAAVQYASKNRMQVTAVRYPVVIGAHDYTKRLYFYAACIRNGTPMQIDDPDARLSLIHEQDAGNFLAHIADTAISGAVNGCSDGDISVREILAYLEARLGRKAILRSDGTAAPYNGYPAFATLDTAKAKQTGFRFSDIRKAVSETLDGYCAALA